MWEATPVLPLSHLGRRLGRDDPAPREEPQHTRSHLALHRCGVFVREPPSLMKLQAFLSTEHAIEDGAVEMQVGIERGAEAMDEGHRPEAGLRGCAGTGGFEPILRGARGPADGPRRETGRDGGDGALSVLAARVVRHRTDVHRGCQTDRTLSQAPRERTAGRGPPGKAGDAMTTCGVPGCLRSSPQAQQARDLVLA